MTSKRHSKFTVDLIYIYMLVYGGMSEKKVDVCEENLQVM